MEEIHRKRLFGTGGRLSESGFLRQARAPLYKSSLLLRYHSCPYIFLPQGNSITGNRLLISPSFRSCISVHLITTLNSQLCFILHSPRQPLGKGAADRVSTGWRPFSGADEAAQPVCVLIGRLHTEHIMRPYWCSLTCDYLATAPLAVITSMVHCASFEHLAFWDLKRELSLCLVYVRRVGVKSLLPKLEEPVWLNVIVSKTLLKDRINRVHIEISVL